MLIDRTVIIKFGEGIYPFDDAVNVTKEERLRGSGRRRTLLWAPNSDFIFHSAGGSTYNFMDTISIEAMGSVMRMDAVNKSVMHGLRCTEGHFISYASHTFWIDDTSGGVVPTYGCTFKNCHMYAGADKSFFANFGSASNIYDDVVDSHMYFTGQATRFKGVPRSIFLNSNVWNYCNSNISYGGVKYVAYYDKGGMSFSFRASRNLFENNIESFEAIVKGSGTGSNLVLSVKDNVYDGISRETGQHYILNFGNTTILDWDCPTPIKGSATVRNRSNKIIRLLSNNIDVAGTKYRLVYYPPYSGEQGSTSTLVPPSQAISDEYGFGTTFSQDSDNISWIQLWHSLAPNMQKIPALVNVLDNHVYRNPTHPDDIKYRISAVTRGLVAVREDRVRPLWSYQQYLAYWPLNLTGYVFMVVGDIDLGGNTMLLRPNTTFMFVGGSINNGTIAFNGTVDYINWKGDAVIGAVSKKFGTTANRPTTNVIRGYEYFDNDLGRPVWWGGSDWVDTSETDDVVSTSSEIRFDKNRIHGTFATPITGTLTQVLTGAKARTIIIYYQGATLPKLTGWRYGKNEEDSFVANEKCRIFVTFVVSGDIAASLQML